MVTKTAPSRFGCEFQLAAEHQLSFEGLEPERALFWTVCLWCDDFPRLGRAALLPTSLKKAREHSLSVHGGAL
jgi:hypothetical protein